MANMYDYLSWRGDLDFEQSPFNPVDNIIFSQISYLSLEGIVPGPESKRGISVAQAAELFAEKMREDPSFAPETMILKNAPGFVAALAGARRYRDCELRGYVSQTDLSHEMQFAAISIIFGKQAPFIAYRGTDTSLVGWKEDFNMSFINAVPAQMEAVAYLETMARSLRGPLRVGGHSKGGNLAIYAAVFCSDKVRRRINAIYSNDAPGFHRRVIESRGYQEIRNRIRSFVPESSFVGMLFEHDEDYAVVKSSASGLKQHDLYSWQVTHNDMVRLEKVSERSRFVDKIVRDWINGLDRDQRQRFIEAMYTILGAAQARSLPELSADWFKSALLMIQSLKTIDEPTRNLIGKTLGALVRAVKDNIRVV